MKRSIKELLIILKENINRIGYDKDGKYMETGLCSLVYRLYEEGKFTEDEWCELSNYLHMNVPANGIKRRNMTFPESDFRESAFWFKPCVRLPRYNWIVKHIKINS